MTVKYVEDILALMKKNEVDAFLGHLDRIYSKVEFTYEMEDKGRLNFLDITKNRLEDRFKTQWYLKEHSGM